MLVTLLALGTLIGAPETSLKIGSLPFLAAGLLLLVAAGGLYWRKSWARWVGVAASVTGIMLSLFGLYGAAVELSASYCDRTGVDGSGGVTSAACTPQVDLLLIVLSLFVMGGSVLTLYALTWGSRRYFAGKPPSEW